jgi:hypothetical protein
VKELVDRFAAPKALCDQGVGEMGFLGGFQGDEAGVLAEARAEEGLEIR